MTTEERAKRLFKTLESQPPSKEREEAIAALHRIMEDPEPDGNEAEKLLGPLIEFVD